MSQNVGTLKSITLDGVTFPIAADGKAEIPASSFEVEAQATSGDTMFKLTKRPQSIEGVELQGPEKMLEQLRGKANSLADITMALATVGGSVYRGTGRVHADKWATDTGRITVNLLPIGEWTVFLP